MHALFRILLIGLVSSIAAAQTPPVKLCPAVSEVKWGSSLPIKGQGAILLSQQASPPEQHAAKLLQKFVEKRFGQKWAIHTGSDAAKDAGLRVILGQPKKNPLVKEAMGQSSLTLPEVADGYVLGVRANSAGVITAVVAGTNNRGVIYGQDTLFQLLSKKGEQLSIQQAAIRDWPTVPLRGRPHPHYQYFFKQENFDCILVSRVNFIDLRDGIYAFEPDAKLKHEELGRVVADAKERGLRVYGVVNCGVPAEMHDAVLNLFKQFIDMGCDGLWLSFDDKGPGKAPAEICKKVLDLGRKNGIADDAYAITPPKGSYQVILMPFNREIVAVPGMEKAAWYWTSIPSAQSSKEGDSIGLKVQPSWWHNWPRAEAPALSSGGGDRGYSLIPGMPQGWNHPSYETLEEAGKNVYAVLSWDGWQHQQYYLVPIIGWWSWRPEGHRLDDDRRRIYELVFGPSQVEAAKTFDDVLADVKKKFRYSAGGSEAEPAFPPRLISVDSRSKVVAQLESLRPHIKTLLDQAPRETLIDPETLNQQYLQPMASEIEAGIADASAPYPEYWWPEHQRKVLYAIYDGQLAKADEIIASARDRLNKDITEVERLLNPDRRQSAYTAWWRRQGKLPASEWQSIREKRREQLKERVADYSKVICPLSLMLKGLDDPPTQAGTGAWERYNKVLATVLPEDRETYQGDWIAGIHEKGETKAAVFALERHNPTDAGSYCELPVNIPVSGRRDRLALLLYVADANKESYGLGYAKWRWSGSRGMRVLWNDQELSKIDLGIPRRSGEWFIINVPTLPNDLKTLSLRLRVEDYQNAKNNFEIVYVGPIRLLEMDRD